jgi:hypothetical protein
MRIRVAILCVAALTACAGPAILGRDSRLGPTEGVVVLRLVSDSEFPDRQSISVKSDAGGESFEFVDPIGKLIAVTPAHQLFVSSDDGKSWTGPR